jgi:hypothetical protein
MKLEFTNLVVGGFFAFVTILFLLGLAPSLTRLIYKKPASLGQRQSLALFFLAVTVVCFVLPFGIINVLLALVGLGVIAVRLMKRARKSGHDNVV